MPNTHKNLANTVNPTVEAVEYCFVSVPDVVDVCEEILKVRDSTRSLPLRGKVMFDKTSSSSPFEGWLANNETLHCALQDKSGGKVLLLTDRRLVMLTRVGRKIFTDSEEVLWKNFLGVRQYLGSWSSRLEISIKTASGDIATWRYDGIKKDHAATAYSHLKDEELKQKSRLPKKKPIDEKKHPDINLEFKLNNWENKKDEPKK